MIPRNFVDLYLLLSDRVAFKKTMTFIKIIMSVMKNDKKSYLNQK